MPYGYGNILHRGKVMLTHRVAYELAHGVELEGMVVCHKCDNPPCINPEHLFLGTHADNVHDKMEKGRQTRGFKKSHCVNGHPYTNENTMMVKSVNGPYRRCKVCNTNSYNRWKSKTNTQRQVRHHPSPRVRDTP